MQKAGATTTAVDDATFTPTGGGGGPHAPNLPFSITNNTNATINYNFRRVVMPKHMDVAYALWQMRVLALSGPKAVYRLSLIHI